MIWIKAQGHAPAVTSLIIFTQGHAKMWAKLVAKRDRDKDKRSQW
jgi:hypothetical protein